MTPKSLTDTSQPDSHAKNSFQKNSEEIWYVNSSRTQLTSFWSKSRPITTKLTTTKIIPFSSEIWTGVCSITIPITESQLYEFNKQLWIIKYILDLPSCCGLFVSFYEHLMPDGILTTYIVNSLTDVLHEYWIIKNLEDQAN